LEQNAFDLLVLFGGFVAVMTLPVWIGIVAILKDDES
jgi:hypothetical protein